MFILQDFKNKIIELIGLTLVNGIIQVSCAQFHNTSFEHCIQVSSITIYPPYIFLHYFPLTFFFFPNEKFTFFYQCLSHAYLFSQESLFDPQSSAQGLPHWIEYIFPAMLFFCQWIALNCQLTFHIKRSFYPSNYY